MSIKKRLLLFFVILIFIFNVVSAIDFDCDVNTYYVYGFGDDKVTWLCSINETSTVYECISYIKDSGMGVIQLNPSYQKKTDSVFAIFNKIEDRDSFTTSNGLVSIYFTKENIVFDGRNYTYGVKCASSTDILNYSVVAMPEYENVNAPTTRFMWLDSNVDNIILGLLILFVVVMFIGVGLRELRK